MTLQTVAIAGAAGFVGKALINELSGRFRIIGLTRTPPPTTPSTDSSNDTEWRRCDLFSLQQCENALHGADYAVYLVHSMLPSARLTQGNFQDMDLILADNFARAAARVGIKQIIYLSGFVPEDSELSDHLRSRFEVEQTLSSRGIPVISLRAGIVIGKAGSSFSILTRLLRRVPIILLPSWTKSRTQPVALEDVVGLMRHALENPTFANQSFDVGCPEAMTYADLLKRTAQILGVRPVFLPMGNSSSLWWRYTLAWFVGAPSQLVLPLIASMKHTMIASNQDLQRQAGLPPTPFDEAVRQALSDPTEEAWVSPFRRYWLSRKSAARDVRSVQRMILPEGKSALWAANEYTIWLPLFLRTFIRAEVDEQRNLRIRLRFPNILLLQLTYAADRSSSSDRQLFYVTGGALARLDPSPTGIRPRLEFREALRGKVLLVAIHDFRPTLPWFVYNATQALAHVWVMRRFARHLHETAKHSKR